MQKASVGGILAIVSSVLGALMGLFFLAMPLLMGSIDELDTGNAISDDVMMQFLVVFYAAIGIFYLLVGALGVVGGIFAINRKKFGLALAGAIASSLSFYPLGIVAVILVSMAYPEFNRTPTPQVVPPSMPPFS